MNGPIRRYESANSRSKHPDHHDLTPERIPMAELTQAKPNHPIFAIIKRMIDQYHPYLNVMQPQLDLRVVLATPEKAGIPAVKLHGYPCVATIGVVPYKQRIRGAGDAVLTIDTAEWGDLHEEERESTIDHELEHLHFPGMRQLGESWVPNLDKSERPIIQIKLHDLVVGGFKVVAERHGDNAIEKQAIDLINSRLRQSSLPFMHDEADESTVTFSSGGKSVTLTGDKLRKIADGRRTRKADVDEMLPAQALA